jgi:acyl-CoA synthetase (AMP-forming)/AMP-acid ligase II
MILGGERPELEDACSRTTLDDLFRQAVARHSRAIALADPPDRSRVTEGSPRRLTFAETNRAISAIAARLRQLGLPTDAVIAIQLPNTVESVITLLGIIRAGMIAALLPLLWRKADIVRALRRINARAFITSSRIGTTSHGELAAQTAAELFSIRHVGVFGDAPDGSVPFDDLLHAEKEEGVPPVNRSNPASHIAVITFDVTGDGIVPVARNHAQLIAGGLGPTFEGRIGRDATILSTIPIGSFAGLSLSLMPWLLSGGTLVLHHPFDFHSYAAQLRAFHCDATVLPGPLLYSLADTGHLAGADVKTILALWRGPERLASAPPWREAATLVDVAAFGEIGLIAALRPAGQAPMHFPLGKISVPSEGSNALPIMELSRSKTGTLLLRGPMTPQHAFPADAEQRHEPHFDTRADGFIDTGYGCTLVDLNALAVTSPPCGITSVGGYRLATRNLDATIAKCAPDATVFAVPHALMGQRLAGGAPDRVKATAALQAHGENPLVLAAFRPSRTSASA